MPEKCDRRSILIDESRTIKLSDVLVIAPAQLLGLSDQSNEDPAEPVTGVTESMSEPEELTKENTTLLENIKMIVKKRKISMKKMERELGFSDGAIWKWEKWKPSYDKVVAVAGYLGVTVDCLVGKKVKYDSDLQELMTTAEGMSREDIALLISIANRLKDSKK